MNTIKKPRSLRACVVNDASTGRPDPVHAKKVTAVFGLMAVASISGAEAQTSPLPPVTVDAPTARPRPAVKPNVADVRARNAIRRAARERRAAQQAAVPFPNAGGLVPPDANPYADAAAPYKVDRLSGSKFTEPLLNTPRTVTVLTKELLQDKNATTLREVARSTAGVTLGTGEGGNAFGDRFFIRGFDVRNDIFIDGVRDPGVSIRENFFTEQVEILRGPASSFAGRGTAGGAINIVTKQAGDRNFYNAETTFGTDRTKRVTFDVNQVINPTLAIRLGGLFQDAGVAGRNFVEDDRWGGLAAIKWTPTDAFKVTANYIHTDLDGKPDFGVPYYKSAGTTGRPFTEVGVPRDTYYGFVNRDFQKIKQDIGTLNIEAALADNITISNKSRAQSSVLNYIGTLPEAPNPLLFTYTANAQSRYQKTDVLANQTDVKLEYDAGPFKHTTIVGAEVSREEVSIDAYTGLRSENSGSGVFNSNGALANQSVFNPQNNLPFPNFNPQLTGNATLIPIDTKSVYLIDTANYRDFIILNGGVRYDDYDITASKALTGQSVSAQSGMLNYNGGIVVKPAPYASVYAAYATSSNPVGAEVDGTSATYGGLSPTSTVNQIFAPEQNKAAEVGTKAEAFDRRLSLSAAFFHTEKTNARENIGGVIRATGAYRVQGLDFETGGKINDRWSVFGGLVLMDTVVTRSFTASNINRPLANIANQSFNILTKYNFTDRFELGGQATYRSKIFGGSLLTANANTELPSYWRFDTFVEYKIDKNWTAKLFVNNLTNKLYYDAFYQSASPFVFVAPGRSGSLVIAAKF